VTLLVERTPRLFESLDRAPAARSPAAIDPVPSLDDLIARVWRELGAHRVVECPMCASPMQPEYGVHALPVGGRCSSCGSSLR